ncbi:MAG: LysM domain-containing protein [Terriglobales bacterium]
MFEPTSRYAQIEETSLPVRDAEGREREVRYKKRRFLPPSPADETTIVEHSVTQGDRLDNVTARYLGDPTQFWRVCDANGVLHPRELEEIGRAVRIALPNF